MELINRFKYSILILISLLILAPQPAFAMHVMEGFLPFKWCVFWYALSLPFFIAGLLSIKRIINTNLKFKMLLVFAGAFVFVLSALKIPSITGSCAHPTGVGLGTILFGVAPMTVIGVIVLLFQALLLAHGGLSTLGANAFSMAIVGPITAWIVYKTAMKLKIPQAYAIFLAAMLGDWFTYITTATQLAIAFPSSIGGFMASAGKFLSIFALTQIPLAISEGLLTVLIFNILSLHSRNELKELKVITEEENI